mmetsp:Transcript_17376/g.32951  ORF Transcript_17376/g.32951 Transcript_17376/m.32951 type:complete len:1294 (-) Transcript_17376:188-4069(-)
MKMVKKAKTNSCEQDLQQQSPREDQQIDEPSSHSSSFAVQHDEEEEQGEEEDAEEGKGKGEEGATEEVHKQSDEDKSQQETLPRKMSQNQQPSHKNHPITAKHAPLETSQFLPFAPPPSCQQHSVPSSSVSHLNAPNPGAATVAAAVPSETHLHDQSMHPSQYHFYNNNLNKTNPLAVPLMDPLLQVQYYEARMRDHALAYAQYASAAAGAALVAAQIASGPPRLSFQSMISQQSGSFHPFTYPNPPPTAVASHASSFPVMTLNHPSMNGPYHGDGYRGQDGFSPSSSAASPPNYDGYYNHGYFHHEQNSIHDHDATHEDFSNNNHHPNQVYRNISKQKMMSSHCGNKSQNRSSSSSFQHINVKKQKRSSVPSNQDNPPTYSYATNDRFTSSSSSFYPPNMTTDKSNRINRRRRNEHYTNNNAAHLYHRKHHSSGIKSTHSGKKTNRWLITTLDLMGKTGVSALHDLCNKRHWSQPKFVSIELPSPSHKGHDSLSATSNTATCTLSSEFIISVQVNGVELGRGRGGSKKSAQNDAARKALMVLYPDVVFDMNGILLELGKVDKSHVIFGQGEHDEDVDDGRGDEGGNNGEEEQDHVYSGKSCSALSSKSHEKEDDTEETDGNGGCCPLEDMASRLVIDGNATESGRLSPVPSEGDSSISSSVISNSKRVLRPSAIVTGGPFIQKAERARNRLAFPSASTTSGISSASEDVDDDEYLASRGASVCSALLNVMVQIDTRIKEPPSYTFDVCANPATLAQQQQQGYYDERDHKTLGSSKRKGIGFSGAGGAIVSKRRSALNSVGRAVTIHRSSFACTASLVLYLDTTMNGNGTNITSKLKDQKGSKNDDDSNQDSERSIEDQFSAKGNHEGDIPSFDSAEKRKQIVESTKDVKIQTLKAIGTGTSKREARHVASAKLLAMLFPKCKGMVQVKAAAEAAREQYAAERAKFKRGAQQEGGKVPRHEAQAQKKNIDQSLNVVEKSLDPPISDEFSCVEEETSKRCAKKIDSADDLAKLSLSEAVEDESLSLQSVDRSKFHTSKQKELGKAIDSAIQTFNDVDDEGEAPYFNEDDFSKTVLRRATMEDLGAIERLLTKDDDDKRQFSKVAPYNILSPIGTKSMIGENTKSCPVGECLDPDLDISATTSQLRASFDVVLLLSRAIGLPDEPPLGLAVISLEVSREKGQSLRIADVVNEVHFPRERLIECLDNLGKIMKFHVEYSAERCDNNSVILTESSLRNVIKMYNKNDSKNYDDDEDPIENQHSRFHGLEPLQSVKEEDYEDEDILKSDQTHKRPKLQ